MREHHVLYCYTDQFCKAGAHTGSATMLWRWDPASYLKQQLGSCNIEDMLQSAYGQTRIEMTEKEKELFRKSLVDKLRIHDGYRRKSQYRVKLKRKQHTVSENLPGGVLLLLRANCHILNTQNPIFARRHFFTGKDSGNRRETLARKKYRGRYFMVEG